MKLVNLVLLCFFATAAHAQRNYKPGKVVTLAGDTLSGQIDDQLWSVNPTLITFRTTAGVEFAYRPGEIKGFTVGSITYYSLLVQYDSSSKKIQRLSESRTPTYKKANLFLKLLLVSRYNLLEFLDDGDRYHYFLQDGDTVEELVNHPFLARKGDEISGMAENKGYLGQLTNYLKDCNSLVVSKNLPYTQESIGKLLMKYADCKGYKSLKSEAGTASVATLSVRRFGVTANVAMEQFESQIPVGAGYGYGLFYSWTRPNKFYKTTYRFELTSNKFPQYTEYFNFGFSNTYRTTDLTSTKLSFIVRSRFGSSRLEPYYSMGVSDLFLNTTQSTGTYKFGVTFGAHLALVAGMGLNFGNFSPEIRFELGSAGYSSLQLVGSYAIFKTRLKKNG